MVTTRARHSANKVMAHHNGDEHNAGNRDGGIKENDGVHNDGNEGSVGNDVDEVNDGYKSPVAKKKCGDQAPPDTDATLAVPTPILAIQVEELRAQLSVFPHGHIGHSGDRLLAEMNQELLKRGTK